jgi:membrane-associated phospholipid phosphatase
MLGCTADYSMPSDHCIVAGAFVTGLWLLHRGYGAAGTVLAIVLAFARVYASVHYPPATIAGPLTGGSPQVNQG